MPLNTVLQEKKNRNINNVTVYFIDFQLKLIISLGGKVNEVPASLLTKAVFRILEEWMASMCFRLVFFKISVVKDQFFLNFNSLLANTFLKDKENELLEKLNEKCGKYDSFFKLILRHKVTVKMLQNFLNAYSKFLYHNLSTTALDQWFPQIYYHIGTCQKCKLSGSIPDLLNQKILVVLLSNLF